MQEYVTDAIVLSVSPRGEADRTLDCYTKQLGRIEVRMIGGRKPLSKLSPHCDVGGLVTVRVVEKNQFTLIDALRINLPSRSGSTNDTFPNTFRIIALVRALTPRGVPDARLWETLKRAVTGGKENVKAFLQILGYDSASASCEACGENPVSLFLLPHHEFFCDRCGSQLAENEIVYCL